MTMSSDLQPTLSTTKETMMSRAAGSSQKPLPSSGFVINSKPWPSDKNNLAVSFLNGSTAEQALVIQLVNDHYNSLPIDIKFSFPAPDSSVSSDIRVNFGLECWSYLGPDAQKSTDETMQLNTDPMSLTQATRIARVRSSILHQFGHALGLVHKHEHRYCTYEKQGLQGKCQNVDGETEDLSHDPQSIMNFEITNFSNDTADQAKALENIALSEGDKNMLQRLYPEGREAGKEGFEGILAERLEGVKRKLESLDDVVINPVRILREIREQEQPEVNILRVTDNQDFIAYGGTKVFRGGSVFNIGDTGRVKFSKKGGMHISGNCTVTADLTISHS
ncbi:hypothetical protein F4825DRAFT_477762 [Nemania diffusa]|nr:hypothetical protein F4825DRAFT_477762 [Nemania diffusa]